MIITVTALRKNLSKYLDMANAEDILITKNGKIIAQLSQPPLDKNSILESLIGIAKGSNDNSLDDYKEMRLSAK